MPSTTKYYVIVGQSSIDFRNLYLGFGKTKSEAWDDATGGGRRNRDWNCRECDATMHDSHGAEGSLISKWDF
jgi:hypothetical protein